MGESRTELLAWLNDLLQINYVKVEQCGSGAAYCQVLDSIYGNVPMSRVKFTAKQEYEYMANFKVLQNAFKANGIPNAIPADRLMKCKMQDNLEFLQWLRKYWDQHFSGEGYDAVARRKGQPAGPSATLAPVRPGAAAGLKPGRKTPSGGRAGSSAGGFSADYVNKLQTQLQESMQQMEGLEKERDFYFAKLRDIEILAQQQIETLQADGKEDEVLNEIQKILYSTEDGFEAPEGDVTGHEEEETF